VLACVAGSLLTCTIHGHLRAYEYVHVHISDVSHLCRGRATLSPDLGLGSPLVSVLGLP